MMYNAALDVVRTGRALARSRDVEIRNWMECFELSPDRRVFLIYFSFSICGCASYVAWSITSAEMAIKGADETREDYRKKAKTAAERRVLMFRRAFRKHPKP